MVAHLDEIVRIGLECFFLNLAPFNPRFQGTWIVRANKIPAIQKI